MMTKRTMTKKFMRETGTDKKTAMEYLRINKWNYGQAKLMFYLPDALSNFANAVREIDWTEIFVTMTKAMEEAAKTLAEAMQNVDWNEVIKKIQAERGEINEDPN